jgi:hypothetical protein
MLRLACLRVFPHLISYLPPLKVTRLSEKLITALDLAQLPFGSHGMSTTKTTLTDRTSPLAFIFALLSTMSFGWSVGDIAQAIGLLVNVVRALDSADGAAADYLDSVAFLGCLRQSLVPLQTLSALNIRVQPGYCDKIRLQVEKIRIPIELFLDTTSTFKYSLGGDAKTGHHRHISRKLQWRFITNKKVDDLKSRISSHMRILDALLNGLML